MKRDSQLHEMSLGFVWRRRRPTASSDERLWPDFGSYSFQMLELFGHRSGSEAGSLFPGDPSL